MQSAQPSLQQWVRELTQQQLPVFARTAQRIASTAAEEDSSTSELAAQILQDVSMTTRLLRMANSIHFNPQGGKISTVSRAIVLLGFNVVRDLCLSITIIDSFLSGPDRERAAGSMALAFHAAMQARSLARMAHQSDPEEVFIATLLSHLGELSFICFAGPLQHERVQRLLEAHRLPPAERDLAERRELGFPLRDLTAQLNREWRLSSLLATALDPGSAKDLRCACLSMGNELAEALREGSDSPRLKAALKRCARLFDLPEEGLDERVWDTARAAAESAAGLGAPSAAALIPLHPRHAPPRPPVDASVDLRTVWNAGDSTLQLAILRDISQLLMDSHPSMSSLMEMVLEGIYRGIGMDRAAFALLSPDRRHLRAKSVLCSEAGPLPISFDFPLGTPESGPFGHVLHSHEAAWLGSPQFADLNRQVDPRTRQLCGGHCFLMPLWVGNAPIGALYADRSPSGRGLHDELFGQFKLFGQQARLGLSFLKAR